ncbi:MAG: MoaD/ThiS family protein [Candidatus Thiodiazotropha sp.]
MVNVEFKLFADLMRYLPANARQQSVHVEMPEGSTIYQLMERFQVPQEQAHLVVCNGLFVPPSQRDSYQLQDQDVIALWPPVAGG